MPHHTDFAEALDSHLTALPIVDFYVRTSTRVDQLVIDEVVDFEVTRAQRLYRLMARNGIVPAYDKHAMAYAMDKALLLATELAREDADKINGFSEISPTTR